MSTTLNLQEVFKVTLSLEEIRALRRYQADNRFTKEQLAKALGLGRSTILVITNSDQPIKVNTKTYQAIARAIASNY